ncbi:uncharacterized protein DUF559 [Diaminobutyricimonas aerilata]|uniref:Uncharacterized protein DUF559 n=1 Tax=Diaminobutyricimonas aerilata TaxID=1162967 RepID=A0A2M9CGC8_9MICO|nr:DUF559 domain-containing protein [Diaminobutyricimonas aerilata]PJJ70973.1 uncharacterized protein DUF559 [Diaminobutyricimonas aerilata]
MRRPTPLPPQLPRDGFSTRDAEALGVGRRRLQGRDLHRPFHGVRVAAAPTSVLERCAAYSTRLVNGAFFCSVTAAALQSVPLPLALEGVGLHVGVPAPRRAPQARGVVGHRLTVAAGDVILVHGMPVTGPSRTWRDLASVLDVPDLVAVGDDIIRRRLATVEQLREELARTGRGSVAAKTALGLLDPSAESPMESRLRAVLAASGVQGFEVNRTIALPDGAVYRGDLVFPTERLVVEYQGDYHRDAAQWRRDMTRASRLESFGWRVVMLNADDVRRSQELVARIERMLGREGRRKPRLRG